MLRAPCPGLSERLLEAAAAALITHFSDLSLHVRSRPEGAAQGCPGGVIQAIAGRCRRFRRNDAPAVRSAALRADLRRLFAEQTHLEYLPLGKNNLPKRRPGRPLKALPCQIILYRTAYTMCWTPNRQAIGEGRFQTS